MVLQGSGAISFSQIQTEFGGANPISLSEYYNNASTGYAAGVVNIPASGNSNKLSNYYSLPCPTTFYIDGLFWQAYNGYYNNDVTFPNTYALRNGSQNGKTCNGYAYDITNLTTGTNGSFVSQSNTDHTFSVEWLGYFYTNQYGGTWTVSTNSDDASYLWIGSNALAANYTAANSTVNNGNQHGMVTVSATVSLSAYTYYPLRIQFGENGGGYDMVVTWTPPGGTAFTNGYGYYFTQYSISSTVSSLSAKLLLNGSTAALAAPSALYIKYITGTNTNGVYWINIPNYYANFIYFVPTQIYCIMESSVAGGGWMLTMKANSTGTTFYYYASYWTSNNILNSSDNTRAAADAKYNTFNYCHASDFLALWPDITTTGGTLTLSSTYNCWCWYATKFYQTTSNFGYPLLSFFCGLNNFSLGTAKGAERGNQFSSQGGNSFYGINFTSASWMAVRLGFAWNNEFDWGSNDVTGGIGLGSSGGNWSAGDKINCCQDQSGINRQARFELYVRNYLRLPTPDGSNALRAAPSAQFIKAITGTTTNGVYWINLPTVGPRQIYCIMDSNIDGGGWMMAMKATRGTTFSYYGTDSATPAVCYWTGPNVLNETSFDRTDGDAKFHTMNYFPAKDLLALWPDITTVGGASTVTGAGCWCWLQNDFTSSGTAYGGGNGAASVTLSGVTTRMALINWFNTLQTTTVTNNQEGAKYFIKDAFTFSGWQNGVFSGQYDVRFYGFNYYNNQGSSNGTRTRWGFGWNENSGGNVIFPAADMGSDDVWGGIGTWGNQQLPGAAYHYSAGDGIGCCNQAIGGGTYAGINRSARVEIYVR